MVVLAIYHIFVDMKKLSIEKEFKSLYKEGKDDSKIGKELKVSKSTIRNIRIKLNLPSNFKYTSKISNEDIIKYNKEGLNDVEIAKIVGLNSRQVCLKRNSIGISKVVPSNHRPALTPMERQVVIGSVLGDGSIRMENNARFSFTHSLKQMNYAKWKASLLKEGIGSVGALYNRRDKRTNKVYSSYVVCTLNNKNLNEFYEEFYGINNKKKVSEKLLWELDNLGIAIWFMDDGYKSHSGGYYLATNSFSVEEQETIVRFFKERFDIICTLHGINKDNNCRVYIKKESANKFTSLVKDFIHEDLKYKLH